MRWGAGVARHRSLIMGLMLAAGPLALAACGEEAAPSQARRPAVSGERLTLQPSRAVEWKDVSATITSVDMADARARIPGILQSLSVREGDYVRAAILGFEAVITRECDRRKYGHQDHQKDRKPAEEAFEAEIRAGDHPRSVGDGYWMLKNLRNALAHGNPAALEPVRQIVASPERLPLELQQAMDRALN